MTRPERYATEVRKYYSKGGEQTCAALEASRTPLLGKSIYTEEVRGTMRLLVLSRTALYSVFCFAYMRFSNQAALPTFRPLGKISRSSPLLQYCCLDEGSNRSQRGRYSYKERPRYHVRRVWTYPHRKPNLHSWNTYKYKKRAAKEKVNPAINGVPHQHRRDKMRDTDNYRWDRGSSRLATRGAPFTRLPRKKLVVCSS